MLSIKNLYLMRVNPTLFHIMDTNEFFLYPLIIHLPSKDFQKNIIQMKENIYSAKEYIKYVLEGDYPLIFFQE